MISLLIFAVSYSYGLYEPKYWSTVFIDYTVKRRHSQHTYTHTPMNTRTQTLSLSVSSKIETENSQNWRSHPRRLAVDGKNSVLVQRHINHMFPLREKKTKLCVSSHAILRLSRSDPSRRTGQPSGLVKRTGRLFLFYIKKIKNLKIYVRFEKFQKYTPVALWGRQGSNVIFFFKFATKSLE